MERRGGQYLNRRRYLLSGTPSSGKTTRHPVADVASALRENSFLRISLSAKDKSKQFNNLLCHFTVENFRAAFRSLDGSKAVGIDGIKKKEYEQNLEINLRDLVTRIHKGTYRPNPKREVLIPKANGKTRPIAIATFEDKLVEWVTREILNALYEPIFADHSYGFRPRRNAYQAIKHFYCGLKDNKRPHVVEIDFSSFFNTVPHRPLIKMLEKRITDPRFMSLISRLLEAEIEKSTGQTVSSTIGTPQGSIASPVLANIYLHYVIDEWFRERYHPKGAVAVRYADDVVYSFKTEAEAKEFATAFQKRVQNYQLVINEEKSKTIDFQPRNGNIFNFVGFTFYWSIDRGSNKRRLRVKTSKSTLYKKVNEYDAWIKENRNKVRLQELWDTTKAKLRGHYNYYGLGSNRPKLVHFYHEVTRSLFRWINRRSQRKSMTWEKFHRRLISDPLPIPPPVMALKHLIDRRIYVN